jgi:hypothetical protein
MSRRLRILGATIAVAALGAMTPQPAQAATGKTWCMTYCDTIHLGCKKTVGWFDQDACEEWKRGCLDGCRVND